MTAMQPSGQLDALRAEFKHEWHIFRSQRDGEPMSWCASIRAPGAGVEPLVMADTAEQLRTALIDQREQAGRGRQARHVVIPAGHVHTTGRHLRAVRLCGA